MDYLAYICIMHAYMLYKRFIKNPLLYQRTILSWKEYTYMTVSYCPIL